MKNHIKKKLQDSELNLKAKFYRNSPFFINLNYVSVKMEWERIDEAVSDISESQSSRN